MVKYPYITIPIMKGALFTLLLSITATHLVAQSITIDANGTVRCKGATIGITEVIGGETYEVVDRALLI